MIMETKTNLKSSMMAGNQSAIYQVESFLEESYLFRRNVLNGKTEFFCIKPEEEMEEEQKNWKVLTAEAFNSIVRRAKKLGIGEKKSPRQDIEEYIKSDAVPVFDPIQEYMNKLPKWDGKNHVAALFGKSQADRRRYASFLATTNDEHPLCDPTGSRRYLCLRVPDGEFIDNSSVINYDQLYAQMMYELRDKQTPYWFTNDEVARIQEFNQPFFKVDDLETMISYCFRMPAEEEEGKWMICSEVFDVLHLQYPMLVGSLSTKIKIGQALKFMGCKSKHTRNGQAYQLLALSA